jgi:phytanoyl-CoA hydroxylase
VEYDAERWTQQYERDGYLVVENCLDALTLELLRRQLDPILAHPDDVPAGLRRHVQTEGEYVAGRRDDRASSPDGTGDAVRLVMELPLFDPAFAQLIGYEPVLDVLQALFGTSEFHFHNYKCVNKAPHASSAFVWHRDLPYLYHSTPNLITAMLCLDDMTVDNGATVVLPGSHRLAGADVALSDQDIPEADLPAGFERTVVECPAGSVVLFHVNILHGGGANRSSTARRNVIGIWAGPETYPTGAARYAYQDLYPRSADPARRRQWEMAFPTR